MIMLITVHQGSPSFPYFIFTEPNASISVSSTFLVLPFLSQKGGAKNALLRQKISPSEDAEQGFAFGNHDFLKKIE